MMGATDDRMALSSVHGDETQDAKFANLQRNTHSQTALLTMATSTAFVLDDTESFSSMSLGVPHARQSEQNEQNGLVSPETQQEVLMSDDADGDEQDEEEDMPLATPSADDAERRQETHTVQSVFETVDLTSSNLSPRQYQIELFERAKVENVIACLDTGSGKTYISIMMLEHTNTQELRQCGLLPGEQGRSAEPPPKQKRRSLFLANMVPLVHQQARVIETQSTLTVAKLYGENAMGLDLLKIESWDYLARTGPFDVLVSTPQVVLDALNRAFIRMQDINLVVIDEAHHAIGNNSYARIMDSHYQQTPLAQRPRIFGMTASPLKAKGRYADAAHQLQVTLYAKIFTASQELRKEIAHFSTRPVTSVIEYDEPQVPFGDSSITKKVVQACEAQYPTAMKYVDRMRVHDVEHGPLVAELAWHGSEKEFARRTERKIELLKEEAERSNAYNFLDESYLARLREYGEDAIDVQDGIYNRCRKYARQAAASAAIQVVLRDCPPVPETVVVDATNASPKILTLLALLDTIGSQPVVRDAFCGIIFVETRRTAIALAGLLKRVESLRAWLRPEWSTGYAEQGTEGLDWARQEEVIQRFGKAGEINVIVATNVVESKGRARHTSSHFVILVRRDKAEHRDIIRSVEKTDREIEEWLRRLPPDQKALPLLGPDIESDTSSPKRKREHDKELVLNSASTGASLRPSDCIALLHHFVATLHTDSPVPLRPEFFVEMFQPQNDDIGKASPPLFRQTVYLPSNAKVRKVVGHWHSSKRLAQQHVAFICCTKLYEAGELDENLLPRKKIKTARQRKPRRSAGRGTIEELRAFHAVKTRSPSAFVDLPLEDSVVQELDLWVTLVPLHGARTDARNVILVTARPLDRFAEVTLFAKDPVTIPATDASCKRTFSVNELCSASRFTYVMMCLMTRLHLSGGNDESAAGTAKVSGALELKALSYYMLPAEIEDITAQQSSRCLQIDWDEIKRCSNELFRCATSVIAHVDHKNSYTLFDTESFLFNHPFKILAVRHDLTPMSVLPDSPSRQPARSILEIEQAKRRKMDLGSILDTQQPLVEAVRLIPRHDYLKKTAGEIRRLRDRDQKAVFLVPQLAYMAPISLDMSISASFFPSVMMRYEQCLLAREFNRDRLGKSIDDEMTLVSALTFPGLQYETSYEVLEFVGDSVLKVMASNWIFAQNASLDEGELSQVTGEVLCNNRLSFVALHHGIASYAAVKSFNRKSWRPYHARDSTVKIAKKGLADLVEAILGAAWKSGGLTAAYSCATHLDVFGSPVDEASLRLAYAAQQLNLEHGQDWQTFSDAGGLIRLQDLLGYTFQSPALAFQACTHESQLASVLPSYQRLEFLGDAILDLLVVETLLQESPDLDEGQYTERKSNAVCNASLSVACIQLGLYKHLRHGSPVIARAVSVFQYEVEYAQKQRSKMDDTVPIPLSAHMNGPKVLADILEALLGAVFADSKFDFNTARHVYNKM